nr:hypothetical protein [Tanacetum cinerariifolium]
IPSSVNLHSQDDPSVDNYRRIEKHDREVHELKAKAATQEEMYNQMKKFMEGGPTMFSTSASTSFFEEAQATPSRMSSRHLLSHTTTLNFMTPRPQQEYVQWSSQYQATVDPRGEYSSLHICDVCGVILIHTVAPKKQPAKSKNMARNSKVPAFDLGNAVIDDNLVDGEVAITGTHETDEFIWYTNVDPNKTFINKPHLVYLDCHVKGYRAMEVFWQELVPDLYMSGYYSLDEPEKEGWLLDDQINCWIELVIRNRQPGARFTVAKSGTASQHPSSQQFIIKTDEHIKGKLDGSTRPYASWDDVD